MSIITRSPLFWQNFFMDLAARTALLSKDPDRKVGAVLATRTRRQISFGYNGLPSELPDTTERLQDKPFKLAHMVHAEENCLKQTPFNPRGCTLYVTRFPCAHCAQLIVEAGIAQVVAPIPDFGHLRWGESWVRALSMLQVARINIVYTKGNE